MNAQLQTIPQPKTEPIQLQQNIPTWSPALRIAFRFWMIYLGLYCLATQIITSLFTATEGASLPDPATSSAAALRDLLDWRPYFARECAPDRLLGRQQRHQRRYVRLGHGLLPANDCHCRDRGLVTSRPQP